MIAARLLRLYPKAWRQRYGEEMAALLEDRRPNLWTCLDLLRGALDAHLTYHANGGTMPVEARLKADVVRRFVAFMLFGLGFLLLVRLNDPVATFAGPASRFPGMVLLLDLLRFSGVVAAFGVALGGLPLAWVAVRRAAVGRRREVLGPFGWAAGSLVLFLLATLVVATVHRAVIAYLALSLLLLIVGTAAVAALVLRADIAEAQLRRVAIPAALISFGMAAALVSAVALGVLVSTATPSLLVSQDVTPATFSAGILLMALGTAFGLSGGLTVGGARDGTHLA